MIPAAVVFLYLGAVLAIGLAANRAAARRPDAEDGELRAVRAQPTPFHDLRCYG